MTTPAQAFVPVSDGMGQLARACGVATEYWDQAGDLVQVSATTVGAVLAALGLDASTPEGVARGLDEIRLRDWRRMLPPVFVTVQGQQRRLWVHVPHGSPARAWIDLEDGTRRDLHQLDYWVDPVDVDGALIGEASFEVPGDLPLGYHVLRAASGSTQAQCPLVMTPKALDPVAIVGERQWGFMEQVYAMRSRGSWGLGDLRDCADLARWSGSELGAGFLLINPLHAASPVPPMAPSPYLPVTRRFANPIYLRVEDIPEFEHLGPIERGRVEALASGLRAGNDSADLLDRDAVWAVKRLALELVFALGRSPHRQAAFDAYVASQGQGLVDFATWCALVDVHGIEIDGWPPGLDHPRSPAVAEFGREHQGLVRLHAWMQWVLDEQLQQAQQGARDAGMPIGLMHDLAVGVHPDGADAWSLQDVLARGVSVGAPPDMYNQVGQDWSQPPWRPDALADAAFVPYRDMLRTVLRHAGGLRIDHVLGLFRMWWVPQGMPPSAGTFVRFDHEAMIGILCLEAQRAGAVVVGEDLGTVEPWVQDVLRDRGILGTSILWFESDGHGGARWPADWRRDVLASVTVHDLPPTAGFLRDEHVRIRSQLHLLTRPESEERLMAAYERQRWAEIARRLGMLDDDVDISTDQGRDALAIALHRVAASSPARLIGIGLPDVVGDRRAQNQPGTDQEYPNWRVPTTDASGRAVLLEELFQRPALLTAIVDAVRGR
ncbi:MAG: 4-alpha-glucanotransferase [Actinomycetales bacterium]|nr:4-alpha-glucanotransferase [Actinomycetales bacterium]